MTDPHITTRATTADWVEGARPRTLPNAIAPVIAGSGAAYASGGFVWWKALLCMVVAVALVIGVNFANDYSDGIRGTDDARVGPVRLVGSGLASPQSVKLAAFGCFATAGVAGLILAVTTVWWLIAIGLVCIVGAWFYTGGSKPYGYSGFGEVSVFVFFGLVAVLGTQFTQTRSVSIAGVGAAVAVGCFSSAVLVANNLRDIPTDSECGKVTAAVRLGDRKTRILHAFLVTLPLVISVVMMLISPWMLLGVIATPLVWRAHKPVRSGATGLALIPALAGTGLAMLVWSIASAVGFIFAGS